MDRLIAANSVNLAGADGPPVTGTPQYATDGNPALNIPATRWPAYQYNAIQEEIMNVLIAAGITPDKANNAQLLAAITGGKIGRTRLQANTTFHISATGNDVTGNGLTTGTAWATFAHAITVVQQVYDLNGFVITFKWDSAATCTENGIALLGQFVGQGGSPISSPVVQVIFDFNSQQLSVNASACIQISYAGAATVQNVTLVNASVNSSLVASDKGILGIGAGVVFGASPGSHIVAQLGGRVGNTANYSITGGAAQHYNASQGGIISMGTGTTVTLTGTPNFTSAFAQAGSNSIMQTPSMTFTGAATGVRYLSALNATINTLGGGANYFPGNSAGSTATGGQYA